MITNEQITELQREAGAHGDSNMWQICQDALDGDDRAHEECEEVIESAATMVTDEELAADAEQDRRTMCHEYGVHPW